MARLTTDASTGRRMNMSVKFTVRLKSYSFGGFGFGLLGGTTSLLMATAAAVAQFHLARAHHDLSRLDAAQDGDLIAARGA